MIITNANRCCALRDSYSTTGAAKMRCRKAVMPGTKMCRHHGDQNLAKALQRKKELEQELELVNDAVKLLS